MGVLKIWALVATFSVSVKYVKETTCILTALITSDLAPFSRVASVTHVGPVKVQINEMSEMCFTF